MAGIGTLARAAKGAVARHVRTGDTLVSFLVKPNAKQTQLVSPVPLLSDQSTANATSTSIHPLGVQLHAPPRENLANDELLRFSSRLLHVRKDAVELHKGATSRFKVIKVAGLSVDEAEQRLVKALEVASKKK